MLAPLDALTRHPAPSVPRTHLFDQLRITTTSHFRTFNFTSTTSCTGDDDAAIVIAEDAEALAEDAEALAEDAEALRLGGLSA